MNNILNEILDKNELEKIKNKYCNIINKKNYKIKDKNEFYLENKSFFKSINKKYNKKEIIEFATILNKETNLNNLYDAKNLFYCIDFDKISFIQDSIINFNLDNEKINLRKVKIEIENQVINSEKEENEYEDSLMKELELDEQKYI